MQNFSLDFLGWVRNFCHAEFSPAKKSLCKNFPGPVSPPPPFSHPNLGMTVTHPWGALYGASICLFPF